MQSYGDKNSYEGVVEGKVSADRYATGKVLEAAAHFSQKAHLRKEDHIRLRIVVEEVLINILKHGELGTGSSIGYSFKRKNCHAMIEVTDDGVPFDPRQDLSIEDTRHPDGEGGQGWPLIMSWCQVVGYRRERGRNRLHLLLPLKS